MKHDYTKLSGYDFEEFVQYLFQSAWGTRFEIFKAGRDRGKDLSHINDVGATTIVQ
jgi:hypothetical protein